MPSSMMSIARASSLTGKPAANWALYAACCSLVITNASEVGGQGEAGVGGGLAGGQAGDDLAGQRGELRAVPRAGGGDHQGADPVQDEVLIGGRGEQAAGLVDDLAAQAGQVPLGEGDHALARGRVHG